MNAKLRIMDLSAEKHFQNFHRVLNRVAWSKREANRLLLGLLGAAVAVRKPVMLG